MITIEIKPQGLNTAREPYYHLYSGDLFLRQLTEESSGAVWLANAIGQVTSRHPDFGSAVKAVMIGITF